MDCSRVAFGADGRQVVCSGFTPRVAVNSDDGKGQAFDVHPTMADARSTTLLEAPPRLLTWLPGDDQARELSLDGRQQRSHPGEIHFLRPLAGGGFVTCGPERPGGQLQVIRVTRAGDAAPAVLARWTPRPGMRFDQPGVRPFDVDPRLRFFAYGWEEGVYRRALSSAGAAEILVGRHAGRLREVAIDSSGERLASIDETGEVKVWSVATWGLVASSPAEAAARFSTLRFDGVGARLAWATGGEGTRVWDIDGPPGVPPLELRRGGVAYGRQLAFSPDSRWLAGGGFGGTDFWPVGLPHARLLSGHTEGPVNRLAFSPDSRMLLSCARDGARLWALGPAAGTAGLMSVGRDYMCYEAGISPSGRDVVIASPFMGIYTASLAGGAARKVVDLSGRRLALGAIAFHPAKPVVGSSYAAPSERLSLFVVDLESRTYRALPIRERMGGDPYSGCVVDATFARDGTLLTAGDGGIRRWDLERGTATTVLGGEGRFGALAASQDGRRIVALVGRNAGDFLRMADAEIALVDLDTGVRRTLPRPGATTTHAVALDARGERFVTGDSEGAVRVGLVSGGEPHLLLGHSGPVTDVAVSPDGRWIASAAGAEIRLWPMPDLSRAPLHALPHEALMEKLRSLTNLEVVEDQASPTGYRTEIGPFPGWRDVPSW
jgi:WD40 repeat protein